MKIISKFKDYYDSVTSHGVDDSIIYVRETSVESAHINSDILPWRAKGSLGYDVGARSRYIVNKPKFDSYKYFVSPRNYTKLDGLYASFNEGFIIVGSKAYPVWVMKGTQNYFDNSNNSTKLGSPDQTSLLEDARQEIISQSPSQKPEDIQWFKKKKNKHSNDYAKRSYDNVRDNFLKHDFTNFSIECNSPVVLVLPPETFDRNLHINSKDRLPPNDNVIIIKNPRLSNLSFQKTLDPFSCLQEISQFIGGVIPGNQMPMVEISDKDKIGKRGFDPVYGFRTRPK